MILDVLSKNKDKFNILALKKKLKLSPLSGREHLKRLETLKFISREKVKNQYKFILNITPLGEEVLKIFRGLVGKLKDEKKKWLFF